MADIMRVSLLGAMPSGEVWSINPVYKIGGDLGAPVSALQAQSIATAIAAIAVPTGLISQWNATTTLTGCRVEARSLAGILEAQGEGVKAVATPGTGTAPHPFQVSGVISLRTATPGPSGRGRLFLPMTGAGINASSLRITAATATTILSGAKTYLSAIETAIEAVVPNAALIVWSRKSDSWSLVTQLQMGDVLDTQRRRRDTTIEAVTTTPWP
jgi:hypothetical protein